MAELMRVTITKAIPVPVGAPWIRSVLVAAGTVPAVASRLPPGPRPPALTVRLTGDRELRRLNREFMGEDGATDVLSFPAGRNALEPGYIGDLAISWPMASRQAMRFGHGPEVELGLLAVHGLLHLLGWDHAEPGEAADMVTVTLRALALSGLRPAAGRL